MRCRAISKSTDSTGKVTTNVVWFGSTGKILAGFDSVMWDVAKWDEYIGKAKFLNDKKSSYSEGAQAVVDSLTQRLSVIKRELWYAMSYGLPLFEKNRSKVEFDTSILSIVTQHPDVISVERFNSEVRNRQYFCEIMILSKYGQISLQI